MKQQTLWALLLLMSPLATLAAPKAALVIGNSTYAVGDRLANPVNDATDVAAHLRTLGYETILLKDANYDTMLDGLRRLRQLLEPQGVAVFYYAGHGMQVEGQNYLIPVDARMDDRDRVDRDGFKLSNISRSLLQSGTRENLMIIDACRNDPFPRLYRSGERGLARVDSGTRVAGGGADLMMLFAASPGEVAQDGSGRNGLFTGQLLQHLETPGQSMSQLFQQVKKGVLAASHGKQMIYMEGDPLADFYFVPGKAPDASPPLDPEVAFWNSIQASTDASDFAEYLKQYPNGRYAGLARNRQQKYDTKPATPVQSATATANPATTRPAAAKPDVRPAASATASSSLQGNAAIGYTIGYLTGKNIGGKMKDRNVDEAVRGLKDGYAGTPVFAKAALDYNIGYRTGKDVAGTFADLDINQYTTGFNDAYSGRSSLLGEDEMKRILTDYKNRRMEEAQSEFQQKAADNQRQGEAYLAANANKPGVRTTASGLQYQVIRAGTGAQPRPADTVEVHYEGRLIDGTVFDSSIARGQSATFRLDQVISGWTEGVQLMQEGAKYRFTIPAKLAYGELGSGSIPPNAVLIFEVELLKVTRYKK